MQHHNLYNDNFLDSALRSTGFSGAFRHSIPNLLCNFMCYLQHDHHYDAAAFDSCISSHPNGPVIYSFGVSAKRELNIDGAYRSP